MTSNVYPYGEGFQNQVIALALQDSSFYPSYSDVIEPSYFDSVYHSTLMTIFDGLYGDSGKPPTREALNCSLIDYFDASNFDSEFQAVIKNLVALCYKIEVKDRDFVIQKVADFGKSKILEMLLVEANAKLQSGESTDEVWDLFDRGRIKGFGGSRDIEVIGGTLDQSDDICRKDSLFDVTKKLPTRIPSLDSMFRGGLGRTEVGILLGWTGMGKSAYLVSMGAAAVYKRWPVIHASIGELGMSDIRLRYSACLTSVPQDDITGISDGLNGMPSPAFKKEARRIMDEYNPQIFSMWFPSYTKVAALRNLICRCQYQYKIDPAILIIDNASDLSSGKSSGKNYSSYEDKGEVFSELKTLAHDFDIGIWADSQTNRGGKNSERVDVDVIADSVKKAFKADVVLSLNQDAEEYQADRMRLCVVKGRRYKKSSSMIPIQVDYARMQVQEIMAQAQ